MTSPSARGRLRAFLAGHMALVIMVLAIAGLGAAWATKAPCASTYQDAAGNAQLDWLAWRQYEDHCYSDVIPLYSLERLQAGDFPYATSWQDSPGGRDRYMEYPVVTGLLQYGGAVITKAWLTLKGSPDYPDPPEVIMYFTVMVVALAAAWLAAVAMTLPLAARPRDVALMALSPLVAVHAFTNFDTLAVALAAGGLLAWSRQRPLLAGVLLGIGGAAKLYPLFVLGPLLVLCWRAGHLRSWRRAALGATGAWAAVNAPIALLFPTGWLEFFRLNSTRPADYDSIYSAISVLTGWAGFDGPLAADQSPRILNLVSAAAFLAACAGIAAIAMTAQRRPRVASLVFLVVAAFLLTNKVWSPQYSLWLVPLAVLALPRWLPLLAWMAVDAALWVPRLGFFLNIADPARGNSQEVFVRVVLVRDALVLLLCAWVIYTIYRPSADPVRADGPDDPAGGVLNDAPDQVSYAPRWRQSRHARTGPALEPAAHNGP
jgi:uncharacterized membrane protein